MYVCVCVYICVCFWFGPTKLGIRNTAAYSNCDSEKRTQEKKKEASSREDV